MVLLEAVGNKNDDGKHAPGNKKPFCYTWESGDKVKCSNSGNREELVDNNDSETVDDHFSSTVVCSSKTILDS